MRGFVAAVAAVSAAAMACASGGLDATLDASSAGGPPSEGDSATPDVGGGSTDTGAASDTGAAFGADAAGADSARGDLTDGSVVDAGSSDAGVDADAAVSPLLFGSCDPARWVVSASISTPTNPPAFAVDGLPPTRWSSGAGQAVGQYFQIDFGGFVVVDQIILDDSYGPNEHLDYPRGMDVLGSSDGTAFSTTLTSVAFSTDPGAIATMSFAPATTRALRMQLTTGVPALWWSIHELRLGCRPLELDGGADGGHDGGSSDGGGDASPSCAAPDAGWTADSGISPASWKGSASGTGPNDTIQGAFDQNPTTRWTSGQPQSGGEWFKIDLGQVTSISGVSLYLLNGNLGDYPSSYALQLSSDDSTYATVATGLGGPTTTVCVPRQSARYVRVTQTGTGDPSWWSIYEMSVFP